MPVAHTIQLAGRRPSSCMPIERSGTAARAMLLALIGALLAVLLGSAYFGRLPSGSYPDPTEQWTD